MSESRSTNYLDHELIYNEFMAPAVRSALDTLQFPKGSHGIDAGCGPGGILPLMSHFIGSTGHITGIDLSMPHLLHAQKLTKGFAIDHQVSLYQADLSKHLPFSDAIFDWAWIADVLWPPLFPDPLLVIKELCRVVKPNGFIAIFYGNFSRAMLMSGLDWLERLIYSAALYPLKYQIPQSNHPENACSWLRQANIENVKVSVHVACHQPIMDGKHLSYYRTFERY